MQRRVRFTDASFSYGIDEKPFIGYLFQRVAGTHQIPISLSDLSTVAETIDCRLPASLVWLTRGPGGRHALSKTDPPNSSACCIGIVSWCMRALFRWRSQLLPFRGLHVPSAVLLRRRVLLLRWWLLHSAAQVLLTACTVLPANAALLLPATGLSTGTALLRLPRLPESRMGPS